MCTILSLLILLIFGMDKVIYRKGRDFIEASRGQEKAKPIENISGSVLAKVAMLLLSFFLLYNVYHSAIITQEKRRVSEQAKEQVSQLRVENLELALKQESMQSKEFLEVQARDRLNFTGKNEYVFVIPDSVLDMGKEGIEAFLYPPEVLPDEPTYMLWFEFLKNGI